MCGTDEHLVRSESIADLDAQTLPPATDRDKRELTDSFIV